MTAPVPVLAGHYEPGKVVISIVLAILGAYCAIELASRVTAARGRPRFWWLIGGAIAVAIGIWSMHYMGMFAYVLPIPVVYDWPTAVLSYVASFFGAIVALWVVSRPTMGTGRALIGSVLMGGIGISGQHYIAMASMRLDAAHVYSVPLVVVSIFLAIVFSLASLWQMFVLRGETMAYSARKVVSSLLLGLAIPVMHYTAMAAMSFRAGVEKCDTTHGVGISALGILAIVPVNVLVAVVVVLTSVADRLHRNQVLLDRLFDQAPQAVALLDTAHRIVRVNQDFARVFGYSSEEAVGNQLDQLIAPEASRDGEEKSAESPFSEGRIEKEGVRRRKDGSRLHVAMVRVPVTVAHGKTLVYAIYRDITESREAQEALRRSNEQLRWLSSRIFKVQEEEKRHLARELHDEIGQALTAAKIGLQSARSVERLDEVRRRLDDSSAILDQLLQQTRRLSLDLRPPLLDDLGLVAALRWYLDQQAQRAGFRLEFFFDPKLERISPEIETACFRVVQEAITNVVRHARAKTVSAELDRTTDALHVIVRDDGVGFDVTTTLARAEASGRLGLIGMRERVGLVGGELDIKSVPGRGTEIHAFFPIQTVSETRP